MPTEETYRLGLWSILGLKSYTLSMENWVFVVGIFVKVVNLGSGSLRLNLYCSFVHSVE